MTLNVVIEGVSVCMWMRGEGGGGQLINAVVNVGTPCLFLFVFFDGFFFFFFKGYFCLCVFP